MIDSKGDIATSAFEILGVPTDATEEEIRAGYLEQVKANPPERDPAAFRTIQAAYEVARDPISLAKSILSLPDEDDPPRWSDAIEAEAKRPPKMSAEFVLSLGNQGAGRGTPDAQSSSDSRQEVSPSTETGDG
ncbi:MAG: hypothetical protein AAF802_04725 [Planctomycetota bacterium]